MSKEKLPIGWEQPKAKEKKQLENPKVSPKEKRFFDLYETIKHSKIWENNELTYYSDSNTITKISSSNGIISIKKEYKNIPVNSDKCRATYISFSQSGRWEFRAVTKEFFGTGIGGNTKTTEKIITGGEVWEYLDAIQKRFNDFKKQTKAKFIELSANQDKQDADNLIENIEEQTV